MKVSTQETVSQFNHMAETVLRHKDIIKEKGQQAEILVKTGAVYGSIKQVLGQKAKTLQYAIADKNEVRQLLEHDQVKVIDPRQQTKESGLVENIVKSIVDTDKAVVKVSDNQYVVIYDNRAVKKENAVFVTVEALDWAKDTYEKTKEKIGQYYNEFKDKVNDLVNAIRGKTEEKVSFFDKLVEKLKQILSHKPFEKFEVNIDKLPPYLKQSVQYLKELTTGDILVGLILAFVFGFLVVLVVKLVFKLIVKGAQKLMSEQLIYDIIQKPYRYNKYFGEVFIQLNEYDTEYKYGIAKEASELATRLIAHLLLILMIVSVGYIVYVGVTGDIKAVVGAFLVMFSYFVISISIHTSIVGDDKVGEIPSSTITIEDIQKKIMEAVTEMNVLIGAPIVGAIFVLLYRLVKKFIKKNDKMLDIRQQAYTSATFDKDSAQAMFLGGAVGDRFKHVRV